MSTVNSYFDYAKLDESKTQTQKLMFELDRVRQIANIFKTYLT